MMTQIKNFLVFALLLVIFTTGCVNMKNKILLSTEFLLKSNDDSSDFQSLKMRGEDVKIELGELNLTYDSLKLFREKNSIGFAHITFENELPLPINIEEFECIHLFKGKIIADENQDKLKVLHDFVLIKEQTFRLDAKVNQNSFKIGEEVEVRIKFRFIFEGKKKYFDAEVKLKCENKNVPWFLP